MIEAYGPAEWCEDPTEAAERAMESGCMVLVGKPGTDGWLKWIMFADPCGNAYVPINVMAQGDGACWTYELHDDDTVTINPSVLRSGGCNCHFFIRRSRVVWA